MLDVGRLSSTEDHQWELPLWQGVDNKIQAISMFQLLRPLLINLIYPGFGKDDGIPNVNIIVDFAGSMTRPKIRPSITEKNTLENNSHHLWVFITRLPAARSAGTPKSPFHVFHKS